MDFLIIIFGVLILVAVVGVGFLILRKFSWLGKTDKDNQGLLMLQQQMNEMSRVVDEKLGYSHQAMQEQLSQSVKIVQEVTVKLSQLDATNKQVVDFASQLKNLENILKNPKHRGILGEYHLENLLKEFFTPGQYQIQYKFKNGEMVDAAIFVKEKIIPIDAKFSLEKYNLLAQEPDKIRRQNLEREFHHDIKKRIEETSKYVRPQENTLEFAFMFVPAEGVFQQILSSQVGEGAAAQDLISYAFDRGVVMVSPSSLFAYLQTVLIALRSFKIEESVKEVVKRVGQLSKHLIAHETYLQKLGNSLSTTVNMYNHTYQELQKVDKDVLRISGEGGQVEPQTLTRPRV